jgi:CheY-like chemotaxis protein
MEKILLVDDVPYGLAALAAMLRRRFKVLGADPDDAARSALDLWQREADACLAVVDLSLPGSAGEPKSVDVGFRLIADLKQLRPQSWVAARSAYDTPENFARAVALGVDGFMGRDWPRKDVLADILFMRRWATAGATWGGGPVRGLCRAILGRLPDASPQNFDLAACLVAAEWLDARKHFEGPAPEEHEELARWLADWGPGAEKVAGLLALRHRCYGEPRSDKVVDHPRGVDLPRGEDLPYETRILRAAASLARLATTRPGPEALRGTLREQAQWGALDPKVTGALDRLLAEDPTWFDRFFAGRPG